MKAGRRYFFQKQFREMTSFYQELILILNEENENGYLSETNRNVILNLLNKSLIRVFYSDEQLLKGVIRMTEPILELEIEKYIYALDAKADELLQVSQELSRKSNECEQVSQELSRKNNECEQIGRELTQKEEEIALLKRQLMELRRQNETT